MCKKRNMDLVSFESLKENDLVSDVIDALGAYII